MNFGHEITSLELSPRNYIVVGSGVLHALGIRESNDIDLVVDDDTYEQFIQNGWQSRQMAFTEGLAFKQFEAARQWQGKSLNELQADVELINDIPYLSLVVTYTWKKQSARVKDRRDARLIEKYWANLQ